MAAEPPADSDHPLVVEGFQGVLWAQTSVERAALFRQGYRAATDRLDDALADPSWHALPQHEIGDGKPPAVILDIDETVLDNAPFHGTMLAAGRSFDPHVFVDWVSAARAKAFPGALEFVNAAMERGVTVFFVTNRKAELEQATRQNLIAEGFELDADAGSGSSSGSGTDTLLMRGERPEWTWDKTTRRELIARAYRVIMIVGDDFNDFMGQDSAAGLHPSVSERRAFEKRYADYWGQRWFMMPNPVYGSWLGAVYGYQWGLTEERKREIRWQLLETFEP